MARSHGKGKGNDSVVIQPLTLNKGQWVAEKTKKRAIVGHCTAGPSVVSATSDWNRTPVQVATPFIIDEHGVVFQTFPDEHWAYHTGSGEAYDKASIGVELVNPGWLRKDGNNYVPWYKTPYNDRVYDHKTLWRGERFFATYPTIQVAAFAELTAYLMKKHSIDKAFWPTDRFLEYAPAVGKAFNGFLAHSILSNVRYDLGPAFPYAEFQAQVQALQ